MKMLKKLWLPLLFVASWSTQGYADEKVPSRYGGEMVQGKDGKKVPTFTDHNVKLPSNDTNVIHGTGAYSRELMKQQAQKEMLERELNARNQQSTSAFDPRETEIARKEDMCKKLLEPKERSANHFDTYKQAGKSRTPTTKQRESYAACMSGPEAVKAMNELHENRDRIFFAEMDAMNAEMDAEMDAMNADQARRIEANKPAFIQDHFSGSTLHRTGDNYIDPANGTFYHDTGAGLVNTRTGRVTPTH